MSRTRFIVVLTLFALLSLLPPGKAPAGPPAGASGKMVFDAPGAGLDRYHKEKDPAKRLGWLERLAKTHDPRVAIVLAEAMKVGEQQDREAAAWLLRCEYELPYRILASSPSDLLMSHMEDWWKANEADLRRRAAQLPR
jgi:hypothetical protein